MSGPAPKSQRRTTAYATHWLGMSEQWLGDLPSYGVPPEAVIDLRENALVAVHDAICETERALLARAAAAEAEAARLRDALAPFASAAERAKMSMARHPGCSDRLSVGWGIEARHLIAARAALEGQVMTLPPETPGTVSLDMRGRVYSFEYNHKSGMQLLHIELRPGEAEAIIAAAAEANDQARRP